MSFHRLGHFKATAEYHRTTLHIMHLLGHKRIQNTLIYTQLVYFNDQDGHVCNAAKTAYETKTLIESGFEYICKMENIRLFRKRKCKARPFGKSAADRT